MNGENKPLGRKRLFPVAMALAAMAMVWICTFREGPGITADSVDYLSAGQNLADGKGYTAYNNEPYVNWPPMLPTIFAMAALMGIKATTAVCYIHALALGAVVMISTYWVLQKTRSLLPTIAAGALIACGLPIFQAYIMVWSEPLFILLVLLFLIQSKVLLDELTLSKLVLISVTISLACLTRYHGLALMITGIIMLVLNQKIALKRRIAAALLLVSIVLVPTIAWVGRNWILTGACTGHRGAFAFGYGWLLTRTGRKLFEWFLLHQCTNERIGGVFFVCFIVVSSAVLVLLLRRYLKRLTSPTLLPMLSCSLFIVVFLGVLLASSISVRFASINQRLLSPMFIPIVLLMVFAAYGIVRKRIRHSSRSRSVSFMIRTRGVLGLVLLWAGFCSITTLSGIYRHFQTDDYLLTDGYESPQWKNSPTIAYLQEIPDTSLLISNAPEAIWFLCNHRASFSSPRRRLDPYAEQERIGALLGSENNALLVWFWPVHTRGSRCLAPDEFSCWYQMDILKEYSDGIIYRLKPVSDPLEK